MPRQSAPVSVTGGRGFDFADKVAASLLAKMLSRDFPLGAEFGPIVRIDWETRDSGWLFDDLLLRLLNGNEQHWCAMSVKSNRHLNTNGFNSLFVRDAWEQWHGISGSVFDRSRDFLALTVGQLASTVKQAWDALSEQAIHTSPDRLVQRLENQGQSSELEQTIFESLRTLEDKTVEQPKPYETAELLARIRIFQFGPENESDSIMQCSKVTVSSRVVDGTQLWNRLIGLAAENRSSGGYLDVPKLLKILRRDFALKDFPDYEADWTRLEQISSNNARLVHATIGNDIQIQRPEQEKALLDALDANDVVVLMGESGSGKSALISKIVQTARFNRVVWLLPRQLSEPSLSEVSQRLGLLHGIPEMVEHSVKRSALLVLDGFDRFQNEALTHALELARAVTRDENKWRVLLTCQLHELENVQRNLMQTGITVLKDVPLANPDLQELAKAVQHIPELIVLLQRYGNKANSLKAISLLNYVAHVLDRESRFEIPPDLHL